MASEPPGKAVHARDSVIVAEDYASQLRESAPGQRSKASRRAVATEACSVTPIVSGDSIQRVQWLPGIRQRRRVGKPNFKGCGDWPQGETKRHVHMWSLGRGVAARAVSLSRSQFALRLLADRQCTSGTKNFRKVAQPIRSGAIKQSGLVQPAVSQFHTLYQLMPVTVAVCT